MKQLLIILTISISASMSMMGQDFLALGEDAYTAGKIDLAVSYFEKGAANGDGRCCAQLSGIYFGGTELGTDLRKSLDWAKKGYDLNDSYSTGMLGYLLLFSKDNQRETHGMDESIRYITEACNMAIEENFYDPLFGSLANILAGYYLEKHDVSNCNKWIDFVANHYIQYPDILGNTSYVLLVLQDYSNAYKYAKLANESEKLYSNFVIGFCLANGVGGVEINQDEAFKHMYASALIGMPNGKAEYIMGVFYEKGIGCKSDKSKANEWYHKGAQKGDDQATKKIQSSK